jgi:hypothetical protein
MNTGLKIQPPFFTFVLYLAIFFCKNIRYFSHKSYPQFINTNKNRPLNGAHFYPNYDFL